MKTKPKVETTYYEDIIQVLKELKKTYPSYRIGQHLSTALDDYGDIWGLTDKEIHYALTKYKAQMEMDTPRETSEEDIEKIIKDGLNLDLSIEEDNG